MYAEGGGGRDAGEGRNAGCKVVLKLSSAARFP